MRKRSQINIKKLALAYRTGWEYMPESEEAGSVLTDIFLDMLEENRWRYEQIWRKQELVFQKVVPEPGDSAGILSGELAVKASGEEHGKWLEEGCEVCVLQEQGMPVRFRTARSLRLTAAKLRYAVYRKGLCAWLTYEEDTEEQSSLVLFQQGGKELSHPVFHWYFQALCDGMEDFRFAVELPGEVHPVSPLPGKWTVSDGKTVYPADWRQTASGFCLEGQTPEFAGNLDGEMYEIRLELTPEEELTEEWAELLCRGYVLKIAAEERETDLCVTDSGTEEGGKIFPFGTSFGEACCCYLSCDRIMAGAEQEILLRFRESYLTEERLPEPSPGEYEKWYKKYPWLRQTETVQEWQAEDTLWEYFNGNLWRPLPGSEAWNTCCHVGTAGRKAYSWNRPRDMKPCTVEGEEHFYIRLRLRRTRNAYAMYYRKAIPVLEEIRFSAGERRIFPAGQKIPGSGEGKAEKMYLGFDRDVTPDNCWYTGERPLSFESGMIKGKGILFGREAFWVELEEKKEEKFACFLPNYLPVCQIPEETGGGIDKGQIRAGDIFYLEPSGMGTLEAVCLCDICCESGGAPVISERQAAEHYFAHFGRLLTLMDMELMLQERYPLLRVESCAFRQEEGTLEVELSCPGGRKKRQGMRGAIGQSGSESSGERAGMRGTIGGPGLESSGERVRIQLRGETEEEVRGRLPEIGKWLEETVSEKGPLWLRGCSVRCRLTQAAGNGFHSEA